MGLLTSESGLTQKLVLTALWIDAALVMAASAWNGGRALENMGDPFGFGILLGLAVDVGLAAALVGDRALHLNGCSEPWGRALRITTALMSLGLNCSVATSEGRTGLAMFHAFLPVLLILLSEYAQSSTLQFRDIADQHLAVDRAQFKAQQREQREIERRRAEGELVDAQDTLAEAQKVRVLAQTEASEATRLRELAEQERDATEAVITATRAAAEKLAQQQRKPTAAKPSGKRKAANPDERRQWIREQRAAGHNPTGADVDREFGPPKTGYRLVRHVEEEIDAELTKVAGGSN